MAFLPIRLQRFHLHVRAEGRSGWGSFPSGQEVFESGDFESVFRILSPSSLLPHPSSAPMIEVFPSKASIFRRIWLTARDDLTVLPNLWISQSTDFKYPEFVEFHWESPQEISAVDIVFDGTLEFLFPTRPTRFPVNRITSIVRHYRVFSWMKSVTGKSCSKCRTTRWLFALTNFLPFQPRRWNLKFWIQTGLTGLKFIRFEPTLESFANNRFAFRLIRIHVSIKQNLPMKALAVIFRLLCLFSLAGLATFIWMQWETETPKQTPSLMSRFPTAMRFFNPPRTAQWKDISEKKGKFKGVFLDNQPVGLNDENPLENALNDLKTSENIIWRGKDYRENMTNWPCSLARIPPFLFLECRKKTWEPNAKVKAEGIAELERSLFPMKRNFPRNVVKKDDGTVIPAVPRENRLRTVMGMLYKDRNDKQTEIARLRSQILERDWAFANPKICSTT